MGGKKLSESIKPDGDITSSNVDSLKDQILKLIDGGVNELTMDLSQVGLVDSSGIGLIIAGHNQLKENDGSLILENVSDDIYKMFCIMRLDKRIVINK